LTVPFRDFAVPFELRLPSGDWGVSRVGASVVEVGTSQPAAGGDPASIHAFIVDEVIADPCNPGASGGGGASRLTVEGMVDTLTRLEGFRVVGVRDVELDGRAGKVVDLENTLDTSACERDPWLPQWTYLGPSGQPIQHGPGGDTQQRVFILDVDGKVFVIDAWIFPFTSMETLAEVERVIDSLRFL
jgi:hypothetical protein